ncbi:Tic22 family protein [Leptolyngbya sp. AN02str]|uniref:Tic22 family protein n=1 Tax=Leptolyngbya sp. AN02str TaxID=3423363 RepID=UPI003D31A3D2
MKSWIRWGAALGCISSVVMGSVVMNAEQALALTQEQVIERLQPVPVFAITNTEGVPLLGSVGEGEQAVSVANVFISRGDAEAFLTQLREDNAQLASSVRITPVSLAEIYELATDESQSAQAIRFAIVPTEEEVQGAVNLLQQQGQGEGFQGVPLFYAESTDSEGGYLTVQQGDRQVIPMYFDQEDLEALLTRVSESEPDLASTMRVQVTSLEGVIQLMQEGDEPELNSILLVPPKESIDFIRSLPNQQGRPNQPAPGN